MLNNSIRLFTVRGIKVGVHYSWLVIFALLTWSNSVYVFPEALPRLPQLEYWILGSITAVLLFVSVLIHELAHSLVALARGLRARSITLFIFGGVSNLSGEPKSPGTEFVVAIVGPLTSFVLAGLAFVVATFVDEPRLDVIASYLVYVNAVLGLFNLVPGFPLDGGRVLRSILWATTHNVERATRWASNVGRLVATLLLGYGAYLLLQREIVGGLWTAAIAYFLFSASSASVRQLVLETRLGGVLARDVAQPVGTTVAPGITVAQVVEAFMLPRNLRAVPVTDNGRLVGVVTTSDVRRVPFAHRNEVSVAEIMGGGAGLLTVRAETPVIDAMELLNEHDLEQVPVLEGSTLIGLLTRADVLRQLQLREALSA